MAEPPAPIAHPRQLREEPLDEFIRLVVILGYLWVVFAFLPIRKGIVLSDYHLGFPEYFLAIVNLLVFGKVVLSCKVFHLGTRVSRQTPQIPSSPSPILSVSRPRKKASQRSRKAS